MHICVFEGGACSLAVCTGRRIELLRNRDGF